MGILSTTTTVNRHCSFPRSHTSSGQLKQLQRTPTFSRSPRFRRAFVNSSMGQAIPLIIVFFLSRRRPELQIALFGNEGRNLRSWGPNFPQFILHLQKYRPDASELQSQNFRLEALQPCSITSQRLWPASAFTRASRCWPTFNRNCYWKPTPAPVTAMQCPLLPAGSCGSIRSP